MTNKIKLDSKRGRPCKYSEPMVRLSLRLTKQQYETAIAIGHQAIREWLESKNNAFHETKR